MEKIVESPDPNYPLEICLKNPPLAAFWAWLIPGAGHLYQRRYVKAILFFVCILGTYFFGLALGGGKVVYASFRKPDMRYPYLCQMGVGLPSLPALIQRDRVIRQQKEPLWNGFMAPPFPVFEGEPDELSEWHHHLKTRFELGTLYTMIAGLLNVLVIYDAFAGPVFVSPDEKKNRPPPGENQRKDQ